jgi:hypothetical protein
MKLGDYVENKKRELLQGGYRHVDFKRAEECEIGRNSTSMLSLRRNRSRLMPRLRK